MAEIRPFGVALGLLANVMIGVALSKLVGLGSCGGINELPCPASAAPSFILLPAGIIISVVAMFFGGGPIVFLGVFAAVGIGSITAGLGSQSDSIRSFALPFGGIFLAVPALLAVGFFLLSRSDGAKPPQVQPQTAPEIQALFAGAAVTPPGSSVTELVKLADLHARGILTDGEFAAAKARVLG